MALPYLNQTSTGADQLAKILQAVQREQTAQNVALNADMNISSQMPKSIYSNPVDQNINTMQTPNMFNNARNLNRSFLSNGNPDFQRGSAELNVGDRKSLNIPSALLQQISVEQNLNAPQGFNAMENYFGKSGSGQYSSYATTQNYLDQLNKMPMFQGSGSMDANRAIAERAQQLYQQKSTLAAKPLTESRNMQGQTTNSGTKGKMDQINNEIAGLPSGVNTRVQGDQNARNATFISEALKRLQGKKATTANLPITERVIK